MTDAAAPELPTTFSPLRYPVFRAIWLANLFSNLGAAMQSVGAAWLMTDLTASNQLVALVQASTVLPILLLGLFAGAIADNHDRRLVMLCSQVGMLAISAVLAIVTYSGLISPMLLLICTLGVGVGTALNAPAWQASVRQQVPPRHLPAAIALNSLSFNVARSIGPALGGLAISLWHVPAVFLLNAVSYVGLIGVLLWWKPPSRAAAKQPMLPAIWIGITHVRGSGPLRAIILRGLALGICMTSFQALLPLVARLSLHGSERDFGLLLGAFGIGSICVIPLLPMMRRWFGIEGVVTSGVILSALALTLAALAHHTPLALLAALFAGAGWATTLVTLNTAMQMRSPDEIFGRCLSIFQAVTFGGMALGSWLWGALADRGGVSFALLISAATLIALQVGLRVRLRLPRVGEGVIPVA
ncbi:MFS transporter [Novosphingobium colocasiae]|uniref:Major facilitator superfamily (MFS) profile domain-containing protein n=1 Tax=Novosphingobium colocasiae TaxID=1256513 RepID=A0A918UCJ9_9SPHN|nr:MFS transporter [Novosphingobium colocasiae]GGY92242.1 hypothetical protein GCM10011614_03740 [Novosphingobium colocasiae]